MALTVFGSVRPDCIGLPDIGDVRLSVSQLRSECCTAIILSALIFSCRRRRRLACYTIVATYYMVNNGGRCAAAEAGWLIRAPPSSRPVCRAPADALVKTKSLVRRRGASAVHMRKFAAVCGRVACGHARVIHGDWFILLNRPTGERRQRSSEGRELNVASEFRLLTSNDKSCNLVRGDGLLWRTRE
jgi:hypothetical protein